MNDNVIQPDDPGERKRNTNLAIWVGVLGLGSFALLYVMFVAVMFLRPGLMFKLMPMPLIVDAALSDGNRTYLVHQKVDMDTVDLRQEKAPEVRHFISVLTGTELGEPREIPPYEHASGAGNRLLFVGKGAYRVYDGNRWTEERSETIGKDPKGLLTPAGVYVLSGGKAGQRLSLLAAGTATDIPLPPDYLAWYRSEQCPCPCEKLAWYQGRLCLFWKGNETISWAILDGTTWSPTATSPYAGGYEVLADGGNLYLFQREGEGLERRLSYYVYANNTWSGPVTLPVKGSFTNWNVFIRQGKPRVFLQQFTTQTLYTVEKGALADPVRLKGPFDAAGMFRWWLLWSVPTGALFLLAVFGVSALIGRFKKRIWREEGAEYEFAGLFRRFLAMVIDKLVLLIPPAIIVASFINGLDDIDVNPFRFMLPIVSAFSLFFLGGFLYHSLLEGLYGQTLGKRLCGIRVVKADFSPCGLAPGFLRNLMRIADAFFYYLVAVISLAASLKWQRVGDLVADTVVVKVNRR